MRQYHSDDALVRRTVPTGQTWTVDVPVYTGTEVLVPIATYTAGQTAVCVRRGELTLPVANGETLSEGALVYWDPETRALYAETASGRFGVGYAGQSYGGRCVVTLSQPAVTPGLTEVGPEDLEPFVPGTSKAGVPYLVPVGFEGQTQIELPGLSACVHIACNILQAAESGEVEVYMGTSVIATIDATETGYEATVPGFNPGTAITISPSTGVQGVIILTMLRYGGT